MRMRHLYSVCLCLALAHVTESAITGVLLQQGSAVILNQPTLFTCRVSGDGATPDPSIRWLLFDAASFDINIASTYQDISSQAVSQTDTNPNDGNRVQTLNLFITTAENGKTLRCLASLGANNQLYVDSNTINPGALGRACDQTNTCNLQNAGCVNGFCTCNSGYYPDSNACLPAVLGGQCDSTLGCQLAGSVTPQCTNNLCICPNNYYRSGASCFVKKGLTASCTNNDECLPANSECRTGVCSCQSGYTASSGQCVIQTTTYYLGQSCTTSSQCTSYVGNSRCSNNFCACNFGYYPIGSTTCNQALLGGSCDINLGCQVQVAGTATPQCTNNVCTCPNNNYYILNGACYFKKALDAVCGSTNECLADNALCSAGTCSCQSGYTASSGQCVVQITYNLGNSCTTSSQCTSYVSNSGCSSGLCACNVGYYPSGTTTCNQAVLGGQCTANLGCSLLIPNTVTPQCVNSRCACPTGYTAFNNGCYTSGIGQVCSSSSTCGVANAGCLSSICSCNSGYTASGTSSCILPALGGSCLTSVGCQFAGTTTPDCTNSVCTCPANYYRLNTGCFAKAGLGGTCQTSVFDSCSDTNARCTGTPGSCTCITNYSNVQGVCTFQSSGDNQCAPSTQNAVTMAGSNSPVAPNVWVRATCYDIPLGNTTVLPCADTRGDGFLQSGGWYTNQTGSFVKVQASTNTFINGDIANPNLTISNAQASFSGWYLCRLCYGAASTACTDSRHIQVNVIGSDIKSTAVTGTNLSPVKGAAVTLTCATTPTDAGTTFVWRRNNVLLGENTDTLTISSVGNNDHGTYTCSATNQYTTGSVTSATVQLNVQFAPENNIPTGGDTQTIITNLASAPRNVECLMSANPDITQYRFLNAQGAELYSGTSNTLTVTASMGYQQYSCTASNSIGVSAAPQYFSVQQTGGGANAAAATEDTGGISTGVIAAIVLGIIFLLLLIIIIIVCCCNYGWCRKKEKVEPEKIVPQPVVKPYIPRSVVSDHGSTVSKRDVGIMMNGHHHAAISTDFEEPAYTPRYYLKPATSTGPIISMYEDNDNQPRAHQLPALDTQYLYREDEPKKKRRRRKKKRHVEENVYEPEPQPRYAETRPAHDDDLVVVPGPNNYYE